MFNDHGGPRAGAITCEFGVKAVLHHHAGAFRRRLSGVASLDILDKVLPFIGTKKKKLRRRRRRFWPRERRRNGALRSQSARNVPVNVSDGHNGLHAHQVGARVHTGQVRDALVSFTALPQGCAPLRPDRPIIVPKRGSPNQNGQGYWWGMSARWSALPDSVLDYRFVVLITHDPRRGWAAILNADYSLRRASGQVSVQNKR